MSTPAPQKSIIPEIPYPPPPTRRMDRRRLQIMLRRRRIVGWVATIAGALLISIVLRTFVLTTTVVEGQSMTPTLQNGQHVLVDKLGLKLFSVRRMDVVLIRLPDEGRVLIKRVVGLPGDRIEWASGQLMLNGLAQAEPYVRYGDSTQLDGVQVPQGMVYVLGDDRADSRDSRVYGCLPQEAMIGRAVAVFWPLSQMRALGGYAQ